MTGMFEDHLSLDAIVAYADGEMSLTAYQRAAAHVSSCPACAGEVAEQTAASQYLRQARGPVHARQSVRCPEVDPGRAPAGRPVPGLAVDPVSGRAVPTAGHPAGRGRRFRLGAGALVAGLAMGAVVVAAAGDVPANDPARPAVPDRSVVSRPSPWWRTTAVDVVARSTAPHAGDVPHALCRSLHW